MSTLGSPTRPVYPIAVGRLGRFRGAAYPIENAPRRPHGGHSRASGSHWVIGYAEPTGPYGRLRARFRPLALGISGIARGRLTHGFTHGKSRLVLDLLSLWVYWVQRENSLLHARAGKHVGKNRERRRRYIERELPSENPTQLPNSHSSPDASLCCERVSSRGRLPECA